MPSKTFESNLVRFGSKFLWFRPCDRPAAPCQVVHRINLEPSAMEFLSTAWWSALLAIILIDLVLAGDNAIVIALAARNLPPHLRRQAVLWGTVGAIAVRAVMTLAVVWLLKIPGLMLAGGVGLVWIAYRLLADDGEQHEQGAAAVTFWGAMKTIVVADALMGVDNVLAVAGAAHGSFDLVVIGLLVSIPIVVGGSSLVLKLVDRFPIIIQAGAAVLAFTAAKMIVGEPLLREVFDQAAARWATYGAVIAGVLAAGWWSARLAARRAERRAHR
jgi:YjbE family integral membrane protein